MIVKIFLSPTIRYWTFVHKFGIVVNVHDVLDILENEQQQQWIYSKICLSSFATYLLDLHPCFSNEINRCKWLFTLTCVCRQYKKKVIDERKSVSSMATITSIWQNWSKLICLSRSPLCPHLFTPIEVKENKIVTMQICVQ